jgi:hypothetical protein
MNELLKGLIGAELTLLGIPNQAWPKVAAPEIEKVWLLGEKHRHDGVQQAVNADDDTRPQIEFSTSDYRSAAG